MKWSQVSAGATDLFWNVAGNIIADLLVIIFIALIGYFSRSRIKAFIKSFRFATRMRKNGISNFYNSRQEYVTARAERSLGEYMLKCRRRFLYVGFYLAGATERDRIDSVLSTLLERGCEIELVLFDPDAPRETIRAVERYLAVPDGTLEQLLRHAHDHFRNSGVACRLPLKTASRSSFIKRLYPVRRCCSMRANLMAVCL
jgi:hypothetical protein